MNKKLFLSMACASTMFMGMSSVSMAASGTTLDFDDINMSITIDGRYNFIYDVANTYGDDISEYGIDEDMIKSNIKSTPGSYFEALYVDEYNYFRESYFCYTECENEIGHLKDYSEADAEKFGKESCKELKDSNDVQGLENVEYKGIYDVGEIPYIEYVVTGTNENGSYTMGCLTTVVNNHGYNYFTRSYSLDVDESLLLEDCKSLVAGVKYTFNEEIKSTANLSGGIDWRKVGSRSAYGAVFGAIVGGVATTIARKTKKNKLKNTVEKA